MNPLELLTQKMPELTKSEQTIAKFILENPVEIIRRNLTYIAQHINSSNTAIIRLCQKLGYKGYGEFKYALSNYATSVVPDQDESNSLHYITSLYTQFLSRMAAEIDIENIKKTAEKIANARRVCVMGYNRTGLPASQLAYRLTKLGIANHILTDHIVMNDYAEIFDEKDTAILFSVSAERYLDTARQFHNNNCNLILFTMNPNPPIKNYCDQIICFPRISYYKSFSPHDDHALFYVFIEVLINEISIALEKLNSGGDANG